MSQNIFEEASKSKLRFSTNRGNLSTEDLWDLPLDELDTVAIGLNKQVQDSAVGSFVRKTNKTNKTLQLRFDVVKSIIDSKLADADKAKETADRKAKRAVLLNKIAEKQDAKLDSMSLNKLQAELDALDVDEDVE